MSSTAARTLSWSSNRSGDLSAHGSSSLGQQLRFDRRPRWPGISTEIWKARRPWSGRSGHNCCCIQAETAPCRRLTGSSKLRRPCFGVGVPDCTKWIVWKDIGIQARQERSSNSLGAIAKRERSERGRRTLAGPDASIAVCQWESCLKLGSRDASCSTCVRTPMNRQTI